MTIRIKAILSLAAVGIAAAALALGWGYREAVRPGPLAEPQRVIVEKGAGLGTIAGMLQQKGAVERELLFKLTAWAMGAGRALRAGEFEIPARASLVEVIETLRSGELIERRLTVPEGLSSLQILALLRRTEGLEGDIEAPPREGSLLPETYSFHYGDSRAALLERMAAAQDRALAELWPGRAGGLPFISAYEAVTLASIVEKETALAEERPLVASVFINRLDRGMRLQSDPTVIYGLTEGAPLGRALTRADLESDTPYNTYRYSGLPPTPIAHPGRASIAAVLNPAETDYLYFVADGSGGHAFAETLTEHNRNVRQWRRRSASERDGAGKDPE